MANSFDPKTNDFLDQYQPTAKSLRRQRLQRVVAGMVYGLILGGVYALVAGTIDALTFPDLPLRVDWGNVWREVAITGLAGLALGAIAGWPENGWVGTLFGAGVIVVWEMGRSLLTVRSALGVFLLIFVLPLVVLSFPMAGAFRWAVSRYTQVLQRPRLRRRVVGAAGVMLVVVALGAFSGSWSRMIGPSESAVRKVHNVLQNVLASPEAGLPQIFRSVPDFRSQASKTYWLDQTASVASPTAILVHITFDNGYTVTCSVDTETDQPKISACAKGRGDPFGDERYNPSDQR